MTKTVKAMAMTMRNLLRVFGGGIAIVLLLSGIVNAQLLSNGVLNTANAADWTQAGVQGGIPSGSWTQCGSTIAAYTGTSATITSAIAACGSNQFVLLGAGTFNLSTGIDFAHKSNVVLRGTVTSQVNQTFLVFGSGATLSCNQPTATEICIESSDGTYFNGNTSYNWTAGYSQGTNTVTLSNTTGISTSTILVLNQCDDGFSGSTCGTGSSNDNGANFNCGTQYTASGPHGCSQSGPNSGNGSTLRYQTELHTITNVNAGTGVVTLGEPLLNNNWTSGRTPQAWFFTPISNVGIEDLSIDTTANTSALYTIDFWNSVNTWVTGVRGINGNIAIVQYFDGVHATLQNSYLWEMTGQDSHAIKHTVTSFMLTQNNICQQQIGCELAEGDDEGSVWGYNYVIANCNYLSPNSSCANTNDGSGLQNAFRIHSNGNSFTLYEGNVGPNYDSDGNHGSGLFQVNFRDTYLGWESCAGVSGGFCGTASFKAVLTNSLILASFNGRYHYMIGSVLGTPNFHTDYQDTTQANDHLAVYAISTSVGGNLPYDPNVLATLTRWGNYDVVTGANRFCATGHTGFSTTCGSVSEVPTGLSVFPNSIPTLGDTVAGQSVMPPSFYLASKPGWFNSIPWPAIGPDVTGGNVGQCSGTLNTPGQFVGMPALTNTQCGGHGITASSWGGHFNAIPAMACYLNTMSGTADGLGTSALTFNPHACYDAVSAATQPSCTPTSGIVPQTVTCTNPNSGTTNMCYTTNGSTPVTNTLGTGCTTGTNYTTAITISVASTLKVVAGTSTLADSSPASYTYSAGSTTVPAPALGLFAISRMEPFLQ